MSKRSRASTSEDARKYRQAGHDDATIFALLLGVKDYLNDPRRKKDVVDPSGDTHSVKSGRKKWQIFLYSRSRFIDDDGFQALNGIGTLLIHCIDVFPPTLEEYERNKEECKIRLMTPMSELKDRFQRKALVRAFLSKALFNAGEVDYLTILENGVYHVFHNQDVVKMLGNNLAVENSKKRREGEFDDQKVVFRYRDRHVCELEMRNDSKMHYRQVRFTMYKDRATEMLIELSEISAKYTDEIMQYGTAVQTFGNW